MTVYILKGIVLPERAQITIFPIKQICIDRTTNKKFEIKLNINLNQITFWVNTDFEWELYYLKNMAESHISNILAIVGFINGCAYNIEITQVINEEKSLDFVYGIDIPCIWERNKNVEINDKLNSLFSKISNSGINSIYLSRCFTDLIMGMKHPNDTGFYCYRAIESLRQYCKNKFNIEKESEQWRKLSEITSYDKEHIQVVKKFADPVRHGDILSITDSDRVEIFMRTWDIVEAFLEKFQDFN